MLEDMRADTKRMAQAKPSGERALLQRIRGRGSRKPFAGLVLGIGDDCALLAPKPGEEIAVTTDLSIDGRHFRLEWHPPEVVGYRTLARGLSDLAAMGARPLAAFLSLGLPPDLIKAEGREASWLDRFFEGFLELARVHKTPLAGGDLSQAPLAVADIVLVGAVPRGRALLRSGAQAGDLVYVTGALGGAAAGLARLSALAASSKKISRRFGPPPIPKKMADTLAAHFYPQPRLAQGAWLQSKGLASSAIDLSDGLSTDLAHLCEESGVAAEIDASSLPLAPEATLKQALHGGEDYELLFTAPPQVRMQGKIAGVTVTAIGRMTRRRRGRPMATIHTKRGAEPLAPRGWEHFS
jgi:thiamine-monophosphate kinase